MNTNHTDITIILDRSSSMAFEASDYEKQAKAGAKTK